MDFRPSIYSRRSTTPKPAASSPSKLLPEQKPSSASKPNDLEHVVVEHIHSVKTREALDHTRLLEQIDDLMKQADQHLQPPFIDVSFSNNAVPSIAPDEEPLFATTTDIHILQEQRSSSSRKKPGKKKANLTSTNSRQKVGADSMARLRREAQKRAGKRGSSRDPHTQKLK